jgi:hypothetical protein
MRILQGGTPRSVQFSDAAAAQLFVSPSSTKHCACFFFSLPVPVKLTLDDQTSFALEGELAFAGRAHHPRKGDFGHSQAAARPRKSHLALFNSDLWRCSGQSSCGGQVGEACSLHPPALLPQWGHEQPATALALHHAVDSTERGSIWEGCTVCLRHGGVAAQCCWLCARRFLAPPGVSPLPSVRLVPPPPSLRQGAC